MFELENFEKDPFEERYRSSFLLNDLDVRIEIWAGPEESRESLQGRLKEKMAWVLGNTFQCLKYAARELLAIKNENWLKEGEEEMPEGKFLRSLRLQSILLPPGGALQLAYHAGEVFWGHAVVVGISPELDFSFATLEG